MRTLTCTGYCGTGHLSFSSPGATATDWPSSSSSNNMGYIEIDEEAVKRTLVAE